MRVAACRVELSLIGHMCHLSGMIGIVGFVRFVCFFFQAEDGIRDLVRSRGLGDVYKRQKLAVGYTLDELKNDITGGATPASFEPSIDYVVTLSLIHI
mgnify:CR=1 FL=1